MPKRILASCVVLCGFALLAASASGQDQPISYTISVGSDKASYDDETKVSAGGEDIGGRATIRINGNPVAFHQSAGKFLTINQMLKPGENTLSFDGKFAKNLYVKVLRIQGNNLLDVVAKKEIAADGTGAARELTFRADLAWTPPFYKDSPKVEDTAETRDGIWQALDQFQKDVAAGHAEEAAARIFEGPRIWLVKCFGATPEALAQMIDQQKSWAESIRKTLKPLAKDDLKFEFGPNAVMVWAGVEAPPLCPAYSFTLNQDGQVTHLPHLIFVRLGGKWTVW